MEILNVIENNNGAISITSFLIPNEESKKSLVNNAEELYRKLAVNNGAYADKELFDDEIGYDTFENDTYSVMLVWSDEVTTIE